ncbi:MAG: hypothetical protein WD136_02770 [Cyanobium sp.]
MRILFDQGTPVPLRRALNDHVVATAYELLTTTSWPRIRQVTGEIRAAIATIGAVSTWSCRFPEHLCLTSNAETPGPCRAGPGPAQRPIAPAALAAPRKTCAFNDQPIRCRDSHSADGTVRIDW